MRLLDFFESLYRPLRLVGCSEKTTEQYRLAVARIGNPDLDTLNDVLLGTFAESRLAAGRSASTVNKELRHVKALWRFAVRRKLITDQPDFRAIPEPHRVPRGWTVTEVSAMLESARQEHGMVGGIPAGVFWRAFILTLWDTGCRKGALLKARPDDFSPTRMLLWIRAENQKRRNEQVFPLSRQTVEALAAMTVHCQPDRQRLFPWQRDGFKGSQYRSLNRHFRRILKRAGLPTTGKYFHRFRASRASYGELTAAGSAQSVLGHADVATTRKYLDPLILCESRLVDRLPRPG